jgi:hypothetical protein
MGVSLILNNERQQKVFQNDAEENGILVTASEGVVKVMDG